MTPEQQRARARARARLRVQQQARERAQPQARQAPNRAQQQETGAYAADRAQRRAQTPFGLGHIVQPIVNMIESPARREELGRSVANVWRDIQQVPGLDWGQLGRDTAQSVQEGVQNLPQTAATVAGHLPEIGRAITYGPFEDEENAMRRMDMARVQGDPQAEQEAAREANAATGQLGLNVAAPAVGGGSALRTAASAAALDAPFALSRGDPETPLQERLPGALTEIGGVAATAGALQQVARSAPRVLAQPSRRMERAADFAEAGVRPTLAAVNQGAEASATRLIAENLVAGPSVRRNLQNSLDDTATQARNLSERAGEAGPRETVGEAVQQGIQRFAREGDIPQPRAGDPATISTREWSFRSKANALYDDVFDVITRDEAGHLSGQTGARATATNTQQALQELQQRVQAPNVAEIVNDPLIQRIASALENDAQAIRFNDLRALRTWVREARTRPSLTQTIDEAALARLESSLTSDIYDSAIALGGEVAARRLHLVDRYYRAGQQRIQTALQPFVPRNGAPSSGAQAYRRIIDLASQGGRQNTRALRQLQSSLRLDEWRQVSATIIDELGRPSFGAPQVLEPGAFSVERFVTNYARLSPEGRQILFGELAGDMDTLARVASYQKGVEAMANRSRSGVNVQNVGTGAALLNPASTGWALLGITGMAITGEMLSNPGFVRWLTSSPKGGRAAGVRSQIAALADLAARDPALAPAAAHLQARQSELAPAVNDNRQSSTQRRVGSSR